LRCRAPARLPCQSCRPSNLRLCLDVVSRPSAPLGRWQATHSARSCR
jgi:hypothetical protein